jgi:hypothetical protein
VPALLLQHASKLPTTECCHISRSPLLCKLGSRLAANPPCSLCCPACVRALLPRVRPRAHAAIALFSQVSSVRRWCPAALPPCSRLLARPRAACPPGCSPSLPPVRTPLRARSAAPRACAAAPTCVRALLPQNVVRFLDPSLCARWDCAWPHPLPAPCARSAACTLSCPACVPVLLPRVRPCVRPAIAPARM